MDLHDKHVKCAYLQVEKHPIFVLEHKHTLQRVHDIVDEPGGDAGGALVNVVAGVEFHDVDKREFAGFGGGDGHGADESEVDTHGGWGADAGGNGGGEGVEVDAEVQCVYTRSDFPDQAGCLGGCHAGEFVVGVVADPEFFGFVEQCPGVVGSGDSEDGVVEVFACDVGDLPEGGAGGGLVGNAEVKVGVNVDDPHASPGGPTESTVRAKGRFVPAAQHYHGVSFADQGINGGAEAVVAAFKVGVVDGDGAHIVERCVVVDCQSGECGHDVFWAA